VEASDYQRIEKYSSRWMWSIEQKR